MAKSAEVALVSSTAAAQQKATAVCTITNGDTDAYVTQVVPRCYPNGGAASNANACSPGTVIPSLTSSNGLFVAGSGTADVSWDAVVFVPQGSSAADQDWDVDAVIYWSTGEVTVATAATLTVSHEP